MLALWLGVAACLPCVTLGAQDTPPPLSANGAEPLTAEQVQTKLDALADNTALTDEAREAAQGYYQTALSRLESAATSAEAAERYRQSVAGLDETLAALGRDVWAAASEPLSAYVPAAGATGQELENALAAAQGRASSLRGSLGDLEAGAQALAGRAVPLQEELTSEHQKLADLEREREAQPPEDEPAAVREAREMSLRARRLARLGRIASLEQELASVPARRQITEAQRNLAKVRLARTDQAITTINERLSALAQAESARQLAEAEREALEQAGRHPLLAAYAEETADLSRGLSETVRATDQATTAQAEAEARARAFEETRDNLRQILEIGAVGEDFADLLRELQAQLPATASVRQRVADHEKATINTRLLRLRVREQRRRLADPAAEVDRLITAAQQRDESVRLNPTERAELGRLVTARHELLDRLDEAYTRYLDRLTVLNKLDTELVAEADALSAVLDEKLLWLPSAAPLGRPWLTRVGVGLGWISDPKAWAGTARHLGFEARRRPVPTAVAVLIAAALLLARRRLRDRLQDLANKTGSPLSDSMWLTTRALVICLIRPVPVSLLLVWAGWLLFRASGGLFVYGLGGGLINAGIVLYILRVFQVMSYKHALFDAHFRWSDRARLTLARHLGWLIPVLLPIAVVVPMTELTNDIVYRNGLGRLAFLIASAALSLFLFRVLHPTRGAAADAVNAFHPLRRTRLLWFPLLSAAPMLLGVLAAAGYYVSALKLQGQLFTSAWVGLVALIVYGLAMRWVLVAHRRLAIRRAREQREKLAAERAAKAQDPDTPESGEPQPPAKETPAIELSTISAQTRTLARVLVGSAFAFALYFIWRDLIPALGALDKVALWSSTEKNADGNEVVSAITLWGLIVAAFITGLTLLAARNLPGLLEMTAFRRLSVDAGTRYAATAIARYIIIAIGLVVAFNHIGIGWGKMQFVVAALGVGLGFGLQEIVANFVSGIIILFERPIRVGDTVTVDTLSGSVARIQIRATTIIDIDNREILVPNKSFITTNVINWTLTDPVTRITVPVGIAYGSDTAKAKRVMEQVVAQSKIILDTPAPSVLFLGFGESSLDFEVRVFVKDFKHRWPVRHELHTEIDKAFRDAGIEIPFPQRDLHIRSDDTKPAGDATDG